MKVENKIIFSIILSSFIIMSLGFTSAIDFDCSIFGCKIISGNLSLVNVNDSTYLQGYTPSDLPLSTPQANYINSVVLGNGSAGSTDYTYINNVVIGNHTNAYQNINISATNLYVNLTNYISSIGLNVSFNNTYTDLAYIKVSNATIGNGIKYWNNQTEGTFQYINANYTASLNYANNILQGNLSANNSKWSSTFNQTYDSFWLSNNTIWTAINSALAGGNASWNQTWAESLFTTFSYVHNIVQGNFSANITKVYENINISATNLYNNLTTNNTASYVPYVGANKNVVLGNNNFSLNRTLTIQGNISLVSNNAQANSTMYHNGTGWCWGVC